MENKYIKKIDFLINIIPYKNDLDKMKIKLYYQINIDIYLKNGKEYKNISVYWDQLNLVPITQGIYKLDKENPNLCDEINKEISIILNDKLSDFFNRYYNLITLKDEKLSYENKE